MSEPGSELQRFLAAIGRKPDEILVISHMAPGDQLRFTQTTVAEADSVVATHAGHASLWFSTQPFARRPAKRGSAEDVSSVVVLYCDLDLKPGALTAEDVPLMIQTLSDVLGARPVAIVRTGGGYQPYWLLSEPVEAGLGELLLGAWKKLVVGTATQLGGKVDPGVYNLDRILRVPGPPNMKVAKDGSLLYGPEGGKTGVVFPSTDTVGPDAMRRIQAAVDQLPAEVRETVAVETRIERSAAAGSGSPLDDFRERGSWGFLIDAGWQLTKGDLDCGYCEWTRPGKHRSAGMSATTDHPSRRGGFKIFTDDPEDTKYLAGGGAVHSKEWAWACLTQKTSTPDMKAATRTLGEAGWGSSASSWADSLPERRVNERAVEAARAVVDNPFAPSDVVAEAERILAEASAAEGDGLIDILDLEDLPPAPALLEGIIEEDTSVILSGKNQTYKTFAAIAWGMAIATGTEWAGHKAPNPRRVIYVAGEGQRGIRKRARAWMDAHERPERGMFMVYPHAIRLNNKDDLDKLYGWVVAREPALLVIDTLHKATPGVEENSSTEMGQVFGSVDAMRSAVPGGFSVLYVHHTGHIGSRSRGSSSIEDDIDAAWLIELEDGDDRHIDNRRILKHAKTKEDELTADRVLLFIRQGDSGYVDLPPENPFVVKKPRSGKPEKPDPGILDKKIFNAVKNHGANSGNKVFTITRGSRTEVLDAIARLVERKILRYDEKGKLSLVESYDERVQWGSQEEFQRLNSPDPTEN